jgi:hypothetical protein
LFGLDAGAGAGTNRAPIPTQNAHSQGRGGSQPELAAPQTAGRHAARALGNHEGSQMTADDQILSRTEVLALLSQKAREGSTSAMIALERALRIGEDEGSQADDFIEHLFQSSKRRDER